MTEEEKKKAIEDALLDNELSSSSNPLLDLDDIINAIYAKGNNDNPNSNGGDFLSATLIMGKELDGPQAKAAIRQWAISRLPEEAPIPLADEWERGYNQAIKETKEALNE